MSAHKIFVFMKNADQTEGRGPMVPVCGFTDKTEAQKVADRLEPYGFSGQFNEVREFTVYNKAEDFPGYPSDENLKKHALAKLTAQEKKLLGL